MESIGIILVLKKLFAWRAIIDIFLIAILLFFLYRTVIRLGTWKIVAGIFIAFAVFSLASLLDLRGIEWIYGTVSQVAVIGLIVLFQPELRKIFERAASMRRVESGGVKTELPGIIANALFMLAQQKRGAILVIPGREPISEWIHGGQSLDATASLPIIASIFDPHSPGHDGALIIENGRLTQFGVRLPVSESKSLPESYGTRHHAAMGLSERSDALVLVVSEERGQISLFRHGDLSPMDSSTQIASSIISHWRETATYAFDIRRGLMQGPALVQFIVSLILAGIFWLNLVAIQSEIVETVLTVPVYYTSLPSSLVLVDNRTDEVRIRIAGEALDLKMLSPNQFRVTLDLSRAVEGDQTLAITEENIQLTKGIQLIDVEPSSIQLTLAFIVEKYLPVIPQLIGKLPNDLSIQQVRVIPEKIMVRMAATLANDNGIHIATTPVYLESIREETTLFGKIIAPPGISPVDKTWPDVQIVVRPKK